MTQIIFIRNSRALYTGTFFPPEIVHRGRLLLLIFPFGDDSHQMWLRLPFSVFVLLLHALPAYKPSRLHKRSRILSNMGCDLSPGPQFPG